MTSTVRLQAQLTDSVVEYLDTAYLTKYDDFNQARARFVRDTVSGPMFREPLFEIQDRYPLSTFTVEQFLASSSALPGLRSDKERAALASLFETSVRGELYEHQVAAARSTLVDRRNVIITTGTGSGKTLAFLLPTLLAIFAEALGDSRRARWQSAGEMPEKAWWRESPRRFKARRSAQCRLPGIRAMLMYPLNALVQDQIEGLRRILDSPRADAVYETLFAGERIFFGQYNGATPGKRRPDDANSLNDCAERLALIERECHDAGPEHRHRMARPFGSELLTRWDMQTAPPDILITNYSMLAVMLVRDIELPILEATRVWLEADRSNTFSLVIDELHSYRGTAGTEISYILKTFLHRIGLSPDHPQLRIIGTSASLEDSATGGRDPQFLSDFFGTTRTSARFNVISGPKVSYLRDSVRPLRSLARIFAEHSRRSGTADSIKATHAELCAATSDGTGKRSLGQTLNDLHVEDALKELAAQKAAELKDDAIATPPLTLREIADGLFAGDAEAA